MAVAFYIPDQATLLRKAYEQEQQILRMRESQWRYLAHIVLDALRQYVDSTPNYMIGRLCKTEYKNKSSKQNH